MAFNSTNNPTYDSGLGDQVGQRANQALGSEVPGGHHHQHHQHGGAKTGDGLSGEYSDQGLGARSGVAAGGVGQASDNSSGLPGAHGIHGEPPHAGNKPSMGDKVKGTFEELKGKVTKDPATQLQGEARKKGDLSGHQQVGLDGY